MDKRVPPRGQGALLKKDKAPPGFHHHFVWTGITLTESDSLKGPQKRPKVESQGQHWVFSNVLAV